jgi:phosphoribosylanthranilate isomerase
VEAGADALGMVFYPKSPRHITIEQARAIVAEVPYPVANVAVVVNQTVEEIMDLIEKVGSRHDKFPASEPYQLTIHDRPGINAVQLHGNESPEMVRQLAYRLKPKGIRIIKALLADDTQPGKELLERATYPDADAYLVELGKGILPGGNAQPWEWQMAESLCRRYPVVLAGGLKTENVEQAVHAAHPAAVDVSSNVEVEPGVKDMEKVRDFIRLVRAIDRSQTTRTHRRIFLCR